MKIRKLWAMLLAAAMVFTLAACGPTNEEPRTAPSETVSESPAPVESEAPSPSQSAQRTHVSLAVLSGPTGVGAAKLLSDSDAGTTLNDYRDYLVASDNNELMSGLTGGTIDIATVASNMAVNLYNKTEGGIKIIALGTQGVLHILEGGGT